MLTVIVDLKDVLWQYGKLDLLKGREHFLQK